MRDALFLWPKDYPWIDMAEKVRKCLAQSGSLGPLCDDPRGRLHTYISRVCLEWGIHPIWVLVSLQREQSLLGKEPRPDRALDLACGFVGSDAPGTVNPAWNGLHNQIWRCARHSAWYAGVTPRELYGYESGLWPTAGRWPGSRSLKIDHGKLLRECRSMGEFVQFTYTPHSHVLATNDRCFEDNVAAFF